MFDTITERIDESTQLDTNATFQRFVFGNDLRKARQALEKSQEASDHAEVDERVSQTSLSSSSRV